MWHDKVASFKSRGATDDVAATQAREMKYDYYFFLALNKSLESITTDGLNSLHPLRDKLYIPAHGLPAFLEAGPGDDSQLKNMTPWEMAEKISDNGLRKDFPDIRLPMCFGGDTMDTAKAPLTKESMAASSGAAGFPEDNTLIPFAQGLATSLSALGFSEAEISAYHAYGILTNRQGWNQSRAEGIVVGRRPDGSPQYHLQNEVEDQRLALYSGHTSKIHIMTMFHITLSITS
ncbi:hypothetical protein [Cupriavidus necator]